MSRIPSIAAGLAMIVAGSVFGVAPAQALTLPQLSKDIVAASSIEQVRDRHHRFRRDFDRHRLRHRHRRHPGVFFEFRFGPMPHYGSYSDSWRAACARKYRSFNWNTGLYFGYDGRYHRCRLP